MDAASSSRRARVLIGGLGYPWLRDASFGLVAAEALRNGELPDGVDVTQLDYGALYAAMDIGDANPRYDRLVLLAGVTRGREPGSLHCTEWEQRALDPVEVQERIREAGGGVIDIDHLLVVAQHFGALPDEVVCIELEPVISSGGEELSPQAAARVDEACALALRAALGIPAGDRRSEPQLTDASR